jgi:hypothetical protein
VTATARAVLLVVVFAAGCGATPTESQPGPVMLPPPKSTASAAHQADPELASFRDNLAHAEDDAEKAGWHVTSEVDIPDRHAAIVLYHPDREHAPAYKSARFDAVGGGPYQVLSQQSGMIDVVRAPGGLYTWDLRGDRKSSVVIDLTPCGANCGVAKPLVLELDGDRFVVPSSAPEDPRSLRDDDHNGVPEFERGLVKLVIAPCSRASCGPSAALMVEVRGLETWDGQKYAMDLAELRPLYFERLKHTRREADSVRNEAKKSKICPLGAIQTAAELFVFSRFVGESRGDALRLADHVMHGYDTAPCATEYDLLAPPKSWNALREELSVVELPDLERPAVRAKK